MWYFHLNPENYICRYTRSDCKRMLCKRTFYNPGLHHLLPDHYHPRDHHRRNRNCEPRCGNFSVVTQGHRLRLSDRRDGDRSDSLGGVDIRHPRRPHGPGRLVGSPARCGELTVRHRRFWRTQPISRGPPTAGLGRRFPDR